MKKSRWIVFGLMSSCTAWAADFTDTAKVIRSEPIMERVSEPRQECWNETVSTTAEVTRPAPDNRSIGGAVVGGLVGGIVGNQVGQGSGKTAATAAGAIAGAILGDKVGNQGAPATQTVTVPQTREERHCRQVENYRDVIRGYLVTYRYNGKTITTRLPNDPGKSVTLGISVLPDTAGAPPPVPR